MRRKVDPETFGKEALPHLDSIFRAALQLACGDRSLADDLVQETFKEALGSFHTYQAGTNCKAWLFRILFRVRSRHFRLQRRLPTVELGEILEQTLAVSDFQSAVESKIMLELVFTLPEHYRIPLILADAEGLSYKEIAGTLNLPIGTVMSRLNRARSLFRAKFSERESSARGGDRKERA